MIECVSYDKNGLKRNSIDNLDIGKDVVWVNMNNPNEKELTKVSKLFNISNRNLVDSLDIKEVPRAVLRNNYCLVILRAITKDKSSPVGIFFGRNYIISVYPKSIKSIDNLAHLCMTKKGSEYLGPGADYLFNKIVSTIIKDFNIEIEKLSDSLEKIENKILKNKIHDMKELFSIKKRFMYVIRAIRANTIAIGKLNDASFGSIKKNYEGHINELLVESNQIEHMAGIYEEKLTYTYQMYLSSMSNRLNDIMKSFTVIASLLLLPMLISGIWGMNFANIPLYNYRYGFYVVSLLMVISLIIMIIFFKFKKWA